MLVKLSNDLLTSTLGKIEEKLLLEALSFWHSALYLDPCIHDGGKRRMVIVAWNSRVQFSSGDDFVFSPSFFFSVSIFFARSLGPGQCLLYSMTQSQVNFCFLTVLGSRED